MGLMTYHPPLLRARAPGQEQGETGPPGPIRRNAFHRAFLLRHGRRTDHGSLPKAGRSSKSNPVTNRCTEEGHEREQPRPAGFQGYHQVKSAREDAELTHVGPGTPCGEYLRRYWQPVAMAEELGALPLVVRILGEDLVLFRDGSGRPGLPAPPLRAPGGVARIRDRGRTRHHLLLPRLALRHRRHHPPGGVGAPRQPRLPPRGAGRLSGA